VLVAYLNNHDTRDTPRPVLTAAHKHSCFGCTCR
jgi:hypothetical protein